MSQQRRTLQVPQKKDKTLVNDAIRTKEVLVIDENGEQLGVMDTRKAIELAESKELDLVCVAVNASPLVTRIMDYSKFRYEQQRKARAAKKNQKIVQNKEIRLSAKIDKHDIETKQRNAIKFLEKGEKVKVQLRFKGREITHSEIGRNVLETFFEGLKEHADMEGSIKQDGRFMHMNLTPKKGK
ncbi:MAG: translation initiation factor IF-3 [Culicoidibacterales bacterium]